MMKLSTISFARICHLTAIVLLFPTILLGQVEPETDLVLLSPFPGTVAVAKKPKIIFRSQLTFHEKDRLFLLDGNDITALVTEENGIYSYTPLAPLKPGEHTLYITA
jgi:hypothetical protein